MTHIIAMAGLKQSGKSTASKFLHGHVLQLTDPTGQFTARISPDGHLIVRTHDSSGNVSEGGLDIDQKTYQFVDWATDRMWPHIKGYNFADTLKDICIEVLGLGWEQCYGTDEQKNTLTGLRWENMAGVITPERLDDCRQLGLMEHAPGPMTGREALQYVGTDIFRRMYQNVWVDNCLRQISNDLPEIAIIGDCRFRNEAEAVKSVGGRVIHLTRGQGGDGHASENDLNGYEDFDAIIDNANMSIDECNAEILRILVEWGVTNPGKKPFTTGAKRV